MADIKSHELLKMSLGIPCVYTLTNISIACILVQYQTPFGICGTSGLIIVNLHKKHTVQPTK